MLIGKIKKDMMSAKIAKYTLRANLLSSLYSEIFTASKSGKEFKEDDELKIVRKFLKNINETLALNIDDKSRDKYEQERLIIEQYLPKQLSVSKIETVVNELISQGKTIKDIMPYFKENFSGMYDGKTVSEIVKQKTKG